MRHLHLFAVPLILSACVGDENAYLCQTRGEKLQAAIDAVRTSPHAILAVKDEQCGSQVYLSGDPTTAQTRSLFRIGSVTKTYVSALILTLLQDGELNLEDGLDTYVPDLPGSEGINLRMLLNHTSGLFDYTEDEIFWADLARDWTPREIVDLALTHAPYFAPGENHRYSNTNYILLGMVAEQITGEGVAELIRERLLEPAELSATFLDGEEALRGTLAPGYDAALNDVTFALDPSGPWAAGAMVASAADVAAWFETLYGSDLILSEASHALLIQDALAPNGVSGYGLGVMLIPAANTGGAGPGLGHGGGIPGYATLGFHFPEKNLTLVGIVNQDNADPNELLVQALQVLAL